jgi:tRNA(Ile)-lysidine synthase
MLRRIDQTIRRHHVVRPGDRWLVGVSGGADSTALLYALWFLAPRWGIEVIAAHLHHGLRGRDADRDQAAVEALCGRLGVDLIVDRVVVRRSASVSLEMAARTARHEFFHAALAASGASAVALAHTADDQAETVLMRLLTGTGTEGLGGMAVRSEPAPGVVVVRPLLEVTRTVVEAFLRAHRIGWREDASNRDAAMLRNRIRHQVLPALEAQGFTAVRAALRRHAEIARDDRAALDEVISGAARQCRDRGGAQDIAVGALTSYPVAVQRGVLRRWLTDAGVGARRLTWACIERIRHHAAIPGDTTIDLDERLRMVKYEGWLRVVAKSPGGEPRKPMPARVQVPGRTDLPEWGLRITVRASRGFHRVESGVDQRPVEVYVARRPGYCPEWLVRSRLPGDRIAQTGMTGTTPVKKLLNDRQVPLAERDRIPLLVDGAVVVWLPGARVARSHAVAGADAPSWRIRWEEWKAPPGAEKQEAWKRHD